MHKHVAVLKWMVPAILAISSAPLAQADSGKKADATVERGKYLVMVGGCNDCHTPGYMQNGGTTPESEWLTGTSVGFQGPWGTTYPANLRLVVSKLSADQWVKHAVQERRPPMPYFNVQKMSESDLRAIYAYVTKLGPKGEPAPAFAPPGQAVATPYFDFVPKNLPEQTAHAAQ